MNGLDVIAKLATTHNSRMATRKLSGNGVRVSKNDVLEADQVLGPIPVPDSYRDFDPQPRFILVRVLGPAGYLVSISFA